MAHNDIGALDTIDRGLYEDDDLADKFSDSGANVFNQAKKGGKEKLLKKLLSFKLCQGTDLQTIRDYWLPKKDINEIKHTLSFTY